MGLSVRTATLRYTEWRNFDTGAVMATELYDHTNDETELHNVIDNPAAPTAFETARRLLHAQFPLKSR